MTHLLATAWPPYAYVPGRHPHPVSDLQGHAFGRAASPVEPLDPADPWRSPVFLRAVDLFNHGYYWEAHEAWEQLWHAAQRTGPVALLLKGLIKLAAAGVKAREGNSVGVQRHASRAAELLRQCAAASPQLLGLFASLRGDELIAVCDTLAVQPVIDPTHTIGGLPVLGVRIDLCDSSSTPAHCI